MSDFYITLQSDSSSLHTEENTMSNFRNYLASTVRVEHETYETALVECTYTHSNALIQKDEKLYGLLTQKDRHDVELNPDLEKNPWGFGTIKETTQKNYYATHDCESVEMLIQMLNEVSQVVTFTITTHHHIQIKWENKTKEQIEYKIEFTPKLEAMLGIENNVNWTMFEQESNKTIISKDRYYFPAGQSRLYVYADIVDKQFIGNSTAPLLRHFNYIGDHEKILTRTFTHLQYVNLARPEFDHIHMYIRTESGDPPPFTVGTFSATLHFRRKRY